MLSFKQSFARNCSQEPQCSYSYVYFHYTFFQKFLDMYIVHIMVKKQFLLLMRHQTSHYFYFNNDAVLKTSLTEETLTFFAKTLHFIKSFTMFCKLHQFSLRMLIFWPKRYILKLILVGLRIRQNILAQVYIWLFPHTSYPTYSVRIKTIINLGHTIQ